jgi:hypothetical protein
MNQRDWSKWLTMATIVHNNACNSTTGFTPSTLLVGWEPTLAPPQKQPSSNLAASRSVEQLRRYHTMATQALNSAAAHYRPMTNLWTMGQQVCDKVRRTLGGDWSRLGSPQTVRPNMLSYFGLLSVTARFGIPRALTLTHLVAFLPPELCGCGFTQWHFSHCICMYFYSRFVSLVAEACLTWEPKMVSLTCI